MQENNMNDVELIAQHTCPVCKEPRHATLDPRKAVREHIRRMAKTSPAHKMWFDAHFSTHFRHGGLMVPRAVPTEEDVIRAIKSSFGEEWSSKFEGKAQPLTAS
jgi:hypothetical protein